jgi:hypothetical protein
MSGVRRELVAHIFLPQQLEQEEKQRMPSSTVRPVPVGKLVSVSRGPRSAPMTLDDALPSRDREVPWLIIAAISGVGAWLFILATLAAFSVHAERPRPEPAAVVALPVVIAPAAAVALPEDIDEDRPAAAVVALERRPARGLPEPGPLAPLPKEDLAAAAPARPGCDRLGTGIDFVRNPPDAFRQARQEGKLVFMVHLSGNFEDTEFT